LGIPLFTTGEHTYSETVEFHDADLRNVIDNNICNLEVNLNGNHCFFQETSSIKFLYKYLHSEGVIKSVIDKNPFKYLYKNNNNCFIHVRLGDVLYLNPGFAYYDKVLSQLNCENYFIASDTIDHVICKKIIEKYNAIIVNIDEIKTIQFGSTSRYIVLSNGSFSSTIGYLAYHTEKIYYPIIKRPWHGDLFCIPEWICVEY
jgi:hypothetical protein